jgi:hypothetical protein
MILLFVPETKDLTIEQLNQVFERSTRDYIKHGLDQLGRFLRYKDIERPVFLPPTEAEYEERDHVGHVVTAFGWKTPIEKTESRLNTSEIDSAILDKRLDRLNKQS